jgi:PAS domain S-box-containing protein
MIGKLKILFVEDVKSDAELIFHEIEKNKISFSKEIVVNKSDYLEKLKDCEPDLIISDYSLPQFDGMTALLLRNEICPMTPFLLVTGSINEIVAVDCMKAGADDYILKDNMSRLGSAILNSITKARLAKEKISAEAELRKSEQRLQKAQSIAHVGNWELDLSTKTIWGSDEAIRIYGLKQEHHEIPYEIVKKSPLPEYRAILDDALDRLLKYNETYDVEFEIKRVSDGNIRSVYSKAELVLEPDGGKVRVVGVLQDITDRKKSVEALKQSELRFKQISDHSGEWIWEVDKNGLYTYSSQIVKQILGYEPEEIVNNKYFYDFFNPDEREELKKAALEAFKRKDSFENFTNSNLHKDGREVILSTSGIPILDVDGNLTGYRGVDTDITERKRAEEALRESQKMIEGIIDAIPVRVFWKDRNLKYLGCNKLLAQDAGFSDPKELLGKDDYKMVWREQAELYRNDDFRVMKTGRAKLLIEESQRTPEGNIITLLTSKLPLLNAKGEISGVLGTYLDITDRKLAEEAVEHERRMLRTLIDNLPDPIYVQDKECRKVIANIADVENIGLKSEAEVLGKTDIELFPGKIGERGYANDLKIITTGKPVFDLEEEFISSEGVKRWLQTTKIPILDKDGNITGLVGIGHDITEKKENLEELIRAKEKAEESDRLKTAFLHNISHEIRTPMNAIVGFSALLGEPDTDLQSRKSYIEVIMQSSNHLLSIISDIVDISNIEANLTKNVKSETDVNSTLKSLVNQFLPKANEKKIKLEWETVLPNSDALILTDRTKLTQVLSNLLSNAIKFTDKGKIRLSFRLKNDFLEFSVADSGIGIAPEHHARIFDRFYQVQSGVSRLYEGTGLGLAISKAYIELLGGKIWLTSEPGKGTTFFFTIPYEKVTVQTKAANELKSPDTFVFTERKKILVAEDIESNYKLIKYFLAGSNTDLIHVLNGKEAVEKCLDDCNFDLILMDIKMPVMDGYTAVKLIREKNSKVPIIAQTAYADDKDKAIECGCTGFISKPFDRKGLFKVLCDYL